LAFLVQEAAGNGKISVDVDVAKLRKNDKPVLAGNNQKIIKKPVGLPEL